MKQLWAPWRMEYIRLKKPSDCILCAKPGENNDDTNRIVYRGKYNFVMMNNYPYNPGHLLIAPYRHIAGLEELKGAEIHEHADITQKCLKIMKTAFDPQGFNIGVNLGKVAGAGIADHVHSHIVPRWQGDTNFMPVIADIRVIPEAVDETYRQLKSLFKR